MKCEVLKMLLITLPAIAIYTWGFNWIWGEIVGMDSVYLKLLIFGAGLILLVRFTAKGFFRKIRNIEEGSAEEKLGG